MIEMVGNTTQSLFKVEFRGDLNFVGKLRALSVELLDSGKSLYEAEDFVHQYCGQSYYEKYGDAVHAIVEDVYNNKVRSEQPLYFDYREGNRMYI